MGMTLFRDVGFGLTECRLCGLRVKMPHVPRRRYVWRNASVGVLHAAQNRHARARHGAAVEWLQNERGRSIYAIRPEVCGPFPR